MEKAHRIGERIFNEHALGVASDEPFGGDARLVGEQDGGVFVAQVLNKQLAEGMVSQSNVLLVDPRGRYLRVGTSSSTTRQAERGKDAISFNKLSDRRRRVIKPMFISSRRTRLG